MRASRYPFPEGNPWTGPFKTVSEVEREARDRNHTRLAGLSEAALVAEAEAE